MVDDGPWNDYIPPQNDTPESGPWEDFQKASSAKPSPKIDAKTEPDKIEPVTTTPAPKQEDKPHPFSKAPWFGEYQALANDPTSLAALNLSSDPSERERQLGIAAKQVYDQKQTALSQNRFGEAAERHAGGLDPETKNSLGFLGGVADTLYKGYNALLATGEGALQTGDDLIDKTGINDGRENPIHPGQGVLALTEGLPLFGAEVGGFGAPKGDTLAPEARAQLNAQANDLFTKGASVADMNAWAKSHGMTEFGPELDEAIARRDAQNAAKTPEAPVEKSPIGEPAKSYGSSDVRKERPSSVNDNYIPSNEPLPGSTHAANDTIGKDGYSPDDEIDLSGVDTTGVHDPEPDLGEDLYSSGKEPPQQPPSGGGEEPPSETPSTPLDKLKNSIDNAEALTDQQKELYSKDRSERIKSFLGERGGVSSKEEADSLRRKLGGELTKVDFTPLKESLSPEDIDSLYSHVTTHKNLDGFEVPKALGALDKLMNGRIPGDGELETLNKVLPEDTAKSLVDLTNKSQKYLPEDWLTSYHYASMLSGYHSLEHNVVGHFFGSIMNNVGEGIGALSGSYLNAVARGLGKAETNLSTLSDLRARMYGYGKILSDSSLYQTTKKSFKENRILGHDVKGTWASGPKLPGILTAPERLHSASYTFFGQIERMANLYQEAHKISRRNGFKGQELTDRINELVAHPSEELATAAMSKANAIRFMGKGDLSQMLNRFLQRPEPDEYLNRIVRFGVQNIAPFANIAEQKLLSTLRYLPILDKVDPFARAQWRSGLAGKQAVISRYMIGMTALTLGANVTDKSLLDSDLVKEIPVLNLVKAAHDAMTKFRALNKNAPNDNKVKEAGESFLSAFGALASGLQEQTVLKSLGDYFVAQSKGDSKSARNYMGRQAQSWLPYSAALKEITSHVDPTKRDISADTKLDTVKNAFKAEIPGLSKTLPAKAGEPLIVNTPSPASTPGASKTPDDGPWNDYKGQQTSEADGPWNDIAKGVPQSNLIAETVLSKMGAKITDKGVRSHEKQKELYEKYSGVAKPGTSDHEVGQAIDFEPGKGMTPSKIKTAFEDEGFQDVKIITKRHGSGYHWHVQWSA